MSRKVKLLERFSSKPNDFSWSELATLLGYFGYEVMNAGKTSGSRARFIKTGLPPIMLHKPHPTPILKRYQIDYIYNMLESEGFL